MKNINLNYHRLLDELDKQYRALYLPKVKEEVKRPPKNKTVKSKSVSLDTYA